MYVLGYQMLQFKFDGKSEYEINGNKNIYILNKNKLILKIKDSPDEELECVFKDNNLITTPIESNQISTVLRKTY